MMSSIIDDNTGIFRPVKLRGTGLSHDFFLFFEHSPKEVLLIYISKNHKQKQEQEKQIQTIPHVSNIKRRILHCKGKYTNSKQEVFFDNSHSLGSAVISVGRPTLTPEII